ncbi:hypothetical protein ICV35_23855 [Rhodococcus ruber]|nr:hypothetical protein [Rhodococcus ruber]MBD8056687.1 hypothetical protein [Rhodococcus ruber]
MSARDDLAIVHAMRTHDRAIGDENEGDYREAFDMLLDRYNLERSRES